MHAFLYNDMILIQIALIFSTEKKKQSTYEPSAYYFANLHAQKQHGVVESIHDDSIQVKSCQVALLSFQACSSVTVHSETKQSSPWTIVLHQTT